MLQGYLDACPPDISGACTVLVKAELPGMSGITLAQRLRAQGFTQSVIVLTEVSDREQRRQALEHGATTAIEESVAQAFLLTRLSELHRGFQHAPDAFGGGLELQDGTRVVFRIMHPEDAEIEQQFVRNFSPRSKHLRGLMTVAAVAGMQRLEAQVLRHNHRMLGLVESLGFASLPCAEDPTIILVRRFLRGKAGTADTRRAG